VFDRADALAGWVNHFLLGLGVTQPKLDKVKDETGEAIDDLRNIAQLGYDEDEDQEELKCLWRRLSNTYALPRCCATTPSLFRNPLRRKFKSRRYTNHSLNRSGGVMTQQEFLSSPGSTGADAAGQRSAHFRRAGSGTQRRFRISLPAEQRFWYFTGFNEPEALLVLIKSDETHNHSVLFNRVRDLTAEIWFGRRLGRSCPAKLGVDRALAFSEINQQLFQLLNGLDAIYFAQGEYAYADDIVFNALEKLRKGVRQNLQAPARSLTGGRWCMRCACLNRQKSWR
jgi:hypothetical protein